MEFWSVLFDLFSFGNVLAIAAGIALGILLGAIPGIGASAALAIFFPLTYALPVETSILFLISLYAGAEYGGSISAIAINAPGTGAAAATLLDGYPLAKAGHPRKALSASLFASFGGGIISAILLSLFAPPLAALGLRFGPAEMFSLALCGIAIIASLSSGNLLKGLLSAAIGFLLATIGMDPFAGVSRFSFNFVFLAEGISEVSVMIGLFAVSEAFIIMEGLLRKKALDTSMLSAVRKEGDSLSLRELWQRKFTVLRGSLIGFIIGVVPGVGANVASFVSYDIERKCAKDKSEFGQGSVAGIMAPEASNNAVVGGALVPSLALGIPGTASAAILLGALIMRGIVPGPFLMTENPHLVYTIFSGYFIGNFIMLALGMAMFSVIVPVLRTPQSIMAPLIIIIAFLGAYVLASNYVDICMAFVFGLIGFIFKKMKIPAVPMLIALLLGGMIERNFLSALLISQGSMKIFVTSPISLCLILVALGSTIWSAWSEMKEQKDKKNA